MQLFAKFKKILRRGFRATLNFRKFKEALKPLRRMFLSFAKSYILSFLMLIFFKELEFEFSFGSGFASKNPFRYIQVNCTAMLALNEDELCSC